VVLLLHVVAEVIYEPREAENGEEIAGLLDAALFTCFIVALVWQELLVGCALPELVELIIIRHFLVIL
jgi:hypothetical protein